MTIHQLRVMLVEARRAKNQDTITLLQMLVSAFQNKAIELGHELTEDEGIALLVKESAKRKDAAQQFLKGGAGDKAAQELAEVAFISQFLPKQMTEDEVIVVIVEEARKIPEGQPVNMATLMKPVRARVGNLYPGKELSALVQTILSND